MATSVATPLERHLGQIADVTEMTSSSSVGSDAHHPAIRPRPRHRRRRARCAGGDQRGARRSAGQPAQQSDLSQGQPGRCADHDPGADLGHADPGPDLRRGDHRAGAEAVADPGHRPGDDRRQFAAGGARRAQSARAVQIRHRPRGRARRARRRQRPQPQGRDRGRRPALPDLRQRPGPDRRSIPLAGHRLSQRRGGAAVRRRRGGRFGREPAQCGSRQRQALGAGDPLSPARRQHHRHRRPGAGGAAAARSLDPQGYRHHRRQRPLDHDPRLAAAMSSARC